MTDTSSTIQHEAENADKRQRSWPLPYALRLPNDLRYPTIGQPMSWRPPKTWWSHTLYRGPQNEKVEILYSNTRSRSEDIAQKFLDEPVVGFDMEWPCFGHKGDRLQDKIGLIQVASETKIALFHIGLHQGTTTEEIVAPSLQKIIESSSITKCGVAILNADGKKLKDHFGLKPQGMFELSHLCNLIAFGENATTRLVSLANQVQRHLGLELSKGDVRRSNWSRPLSPQQIEYAASDAYAGYMLYHCMDAKRRAMKPVPPKPAHADTYMTFKFNNVRLLQLEPTIANTDEYQDKTNSITIEEDIIAALPKSEEKSSTTEGQPEEEPKLRKRKRKEKEADTPLDQESKRLYKDLVEKRKHLAISHGIDMHFKIASNATLEDIARKQPRTMEDLLLVNGIGPWKQEQYGAAWLEVIEKFTGTQPPRTPKRRSPKTSSEPPILHTGLSFTFADTHIEPTTPISPLDGTSDSPPAFETLPATPQRRRRRRSASMQLPIAVAAPATSKPPSPMKRPATPLPPQPTPLSPSSRKFQAALTALSRRLSNALKKPVDSIISESTIELLVATPPRTWPELYRVTDINAFVQACDQQKVHALNFILKHAPVSVEIEIVDLT